MRASDDIDGSVRAEAREWVRRLASGEIEATELRTLNAWIASNPDHARAFERERAFWQDLESHRALFVRPAAVSRSPRQRGRRWTCKPSRPLVASAIAASLLLAMSAPGLLLHIRADRVAGTGEVETVTLPDRSTAMLDTGSAIAVRYADGERSIELLRGRAWFHVAHADARPFTVKVRGGMVEDVGTAFEVSRAKELVEVAVTEGEVRLHAAPGIAPLTLRAGQRARYGDRRAEYLPPVAADRIAAWRNGELLIDDMPLAEAIAGISRYRKGYTLVWADLKGKDRVSGVFSTARPDDALAALAAGAGLQLVHLPAGAVIVR